MKKICVIILIVGFLAVSFLSYAAQKDSSDILKEGVLGAGAGAVGGLASGAKGGNVWKGALAGAGVNIVGGALLDSMSGKKVESVEHVQSMGPQKAYSEGYKEGFHNGYTQGYTQGYKEGHSAR